MELHPALAALQKPENPAESDVVVQESLKEEKVAPSKQQPTEKIQKPKIDFSDPTKNPYFDPSLTTKRGNEVGPKHRAPRASFKFNQHGKYIEQANQMRTMVNIY